MNYKTKKINPAAAVLTTALWLICIASGLGWMINSAETPAISTAVVSSAQEIEMYKLNK